MRTPDGLELALTVTDGPADAPTVLLVHGYPDDHHVWDGLVARLSQRFRCVAYDVRGAGASEAPAGREGYRMGHLVDDLFAVVEQVGAPVHLVAHDWGSIQSWAAVGDPRATGRIASFTSVSGPGLDQAGAWIRRRLRDPRTAGQALGQTARSWYIWVFQLPGLPELFWDRAGGRPGVQKRLVGDVSPTRARDGRNGVQLYRANVLSRLTGPKPGRPTMPVQVVVPDGDPFISPRIHDDLPLTVPELYRRDVHGGHWVVREDPELVARLVTELVEQAPVLEEFRVR